MQSIQRAMQILYAIAGVEDGLTVNQLATKTNLKPNTVYKFTRTMERERLLKRKKSPLRFVIGSSIHELGTLDYERQFLTIASEELIKAQSKLLTATFQLLERDGTVIYRRLYTDDQRPGLVMKCREYEVPLYNKVSSLLLLAYATEEEQQVLMSHHPFGREGQVYWPSIHQLKDYLRKTKRKGYSLCEFPDPGRLYYTAATPVSSPDNEVKAAIGGCIGLEESKASKRRLLEVCFETSEAISKRLQETVDANVGVLSALQQN